jgi:hypothetical protein
MENRTICKTKCELYLLASLLVGHTIRCFLFAKTKCHIIDFYVLNESMSPCVISILSVLFGQIIYINIKMRGDYVISLRFFQRCDLALFVRDNVIPENI